jgi:thymidylate synthase (FAD)
MRIIKPYYEIITTPAEIEIMTSRIGGIARTCYKSEDKANQVSNENLAFQLARNGHEAMIEHCSISVKFICDRGVSHELVRHRMASFAQESTRYCNYSKEKFGKCVTFIRPCFWTECLDEGRPENAYDIWYDAMLDAEEKYLKLIAMGASAQEARSVLPNSLKTEIVVTANLREWRHILKLRTAKAAHPQMRELMIPLAKELHELMPLIFDENVED